MTRARKIGAEHAVLGNRSAIEQHVLDAHVIMKPFEMPQARCRAGGVNMQRGRAMTGEIDVIGAQGGNLKERRLVV